MSQKLTVHDTGPDGNSTYELVVGDDISADEAQELISRSGGFEIFSMHHYENGERIESFISKKLYDMAQQSMVDIPPVRSIEEIRAEIDRSMTSSESNYSDSSWWKFWKK